MATNENKKKRDGTATQSDHHQTGEPIGTDDHHQTGEPITTGDHHQTTEPAS